MPPKKTINHPEVLAISWENLRGSLEECVFHQIIYGPAILSTECEELSGPLVIPPGDRDLKQEDFYRDWMGARIEKGQCYLIDEYHLRRLLPRSRPLMNTLIFLPHDAELGEIQEDSIPEAVCRVARLAGKAVFLEAMRTIPPGIRENIKFSVILRSVADSTNRIFVQRWGRYIAVLMYVDWKRFLGRR